MSRVHFSDVTLEEVVQRSAIVAVAHLADPGHRIEPIAVGRAKPDGEPLAYARHLTRLVVDEVLQGEPGLVGKTLEVTSADDARKLSMYREYAQRGLSRSPVFDRYHGAEPSAATPTLVFLCEDGPTGFAFAVDGAFEALARRAEVEALLAAQEAPTLRPTRREDLLKGRR